MDLLAQALNEPITPWIILAILAVPTSWALARWKKHERTLTKEIGDIRNAVCLGPVLSINNDVERWHRFATEYCEEAKEQLQTGHFSTSLGRQVLAFLRGCTLASEAAVSVSRLESGAHPILELQEHLLEKKIHVPLYRTFPNYLVGIGLCITFLGLAVVINNASNVLKSSRTSGAAVSSPNSSGTTQSGTTQSGTTQSGTTREDKTKGDNTKSGDDALRNLLKAASTKFWASLTAVALSICYGVCFRHSIHRMESAVRTLGHDLGRCVKIITPEELHYESVMLLRQAKERLDVTANGIGLLKTGLEANGNQGQVQHAALLQTLESIANLNASTLADFGKNLESVNEEALAAIATKMAKALDESTERHLQAIAGRLEAISSSLNELPTKFTALVNNFDESIKPISESLISATTSAQEMAEKFAGLPDALKPAEAAAHDLKTSAETVKTIATQISDQNKTVVERWEELSKIISSVDDTLASSIAEVSGVFPSYSAQLQSFSAKWEAAMVQALGGLSARQSDLQESTEELRKERSAWETAANAVAANMEKVQGQISAFGNLIRSQMETQSRIEANSAATGNHLQNTSDQVQQMAMLLNSNIESLRTALEENVGSIRNLSSVLDNSSRMASHNTNGSSAVGELTNPLV